MDKGLSSAPQVRQFLPKNWTRDTVIWRMRELGALEGRQLSTAEWEARHLQPSYATVLQIAPWDDLWEEAGYPQQREGRYQKYRRWSDEQIASAMESAYLRFGKVLSMYEWDHFDLLPTDGTILEHFGTWRNAWARAGFPNAPVAAPVGGRKGAKVTRVAPADPTGQPTAITGTRQRAKVLLDEHRSDLTEKELIIVQALVYGKTLAKVATEMGENLAKISYLIEKAFQKHVLRQPNLPTPKGQKPQMALPVPRSRTAMTRQADAVSPPAPQPRVTDAAPRQQNRRKGQDETMMNAMVAAAKTALSFSQGQAEIILRNRDGSILRVKVSNSGTGEPSVKTGKSTVGARTI